MATATPSIIEVKNPDTQVMIDRIVSTALVSEDGTIYPAFYQPIRGRSNTVAAAIRVLKKNELIVQDGLDGVNRPLYKLTGKAMDLFYGFTIKE